MAKLKIKRGVEANLSIITLDDGEFAVTTDTKKLYVGLAGQKILIASANSLGDMTKGIYDTDNDGIVDQAEKVDWSGVLNKPSSFNPIIATGTVLGGIKVGSNLSVTADGVLSGNSVPESFIPKSERFTISNGQTIFNLTNGYYTPGSLNWSLYGYKQPKEAITEIDSTNFSIPSGLPDGTEFEVQYIQTVNLTPFPYHKNEHLPGGVDDLGLQAVALSGSYNDLINKPISLPANGGNADTLDGIDSTGFMKAVNANGYYGMARPSDGNTTDWIRSTINGIIPYQSGGASSLGTSSWPFANIYANNIYDGGVLLESKYAPIASPAFTGTPTASTPATADNSTNIATTAFVKAQGYITSAGSGAKIAVATTAPVSPSPGDFWYQVL